MSETDAGQVTPPAGTPEAPQWARDAITKANNEAAKYRTEKNAAVQAHTEALTQLAQVTDGKSAAEQARDTAANELSKLSIALDALVPGGRVSTIAARLQGSTEAELKADAQKLVEEFGLNSQTPRYVDPSQGRGADSPVPSTPQSEFAQMLGGLDIFRK